MTLSDIENEIITLKDTLAQTQTRIEQLGQLLEEVKKNETSNKLTFASMSFTDLSGDDYFNLPYICSVHERMIYKQAMFDSRVFNIPKEEVNNCLLWRQQDATRNSIQSVAQANFSHKQLEGKNCNELQEMLWQEKGINWNDYPTHLKRGSCCVKSTYTIEVDGKDVQRSEWKIDNEIPIFSQNPWYVNGRITFE